MHRVAQIRTVHHSMNNHNSAGYTALTGFEPAVDDQRLRESLDLFPGYGSVVDAYYSRALEMLNSRKVREAFNLSKEPDVLREAYGRTTYGQGCLLARRLVESGVKFDTVYFAQSIGGHSD